MNSMMITAVTLAICLISITTGFENDVAKDVEGGVEFIERGKTSLILPSQLTFSLPTECKKHLHLCYASEATEIPSELHADDPNCPPNSCSIGFATNFADVNYAALKEEGETTFITFYDSLQKRCPPKLTDGHHDVFVVALPQCTLTLKGASLPKAPKDEVEEEKEETPENENETSSWLDTHQWVFPIGISLVMLVIVLAVFCCLLYWKCRAPNNDVNVEAVKEKQTSRRAVAASPHLSPNSPMANPAKSPISTPTQSTVPTPATTPTREIEDNAKKIYKKPKGSQATEITKSTTQPSLIPQISPPEENVVHFIEDMIHSLNRLDSLRFKGVIPCQVGSRYHPFVQMVEEMYNTKQRRNIADSELQFFLMITSEAFRAAPALIKEARQELCRHGAIYDHKQWRSFNRITYRFIRKRTTSGFVVAYAMAGEYGNEITFGNDDTKNEKFLSKCSIPALLAVFFREEFHDRIRRSALARLRRRLPQIARLYPEVQCRGMPYPLSLIPALKQKDRKRFEDGANDKTFSTPFELLRQKRKDEATKMEELTDETQVSVSAEALGGPTTTTEEKLF